MVLETILVLETNTSGNAVHIIEAAQALGFEAHYLTRDRNLWISARRDPAKYADRISVVDTIDPIALLKSTLADPVAAIFWLDEVRLLPAAMLGAAKGIITPQQIKAFFTIRYKDLVRAKCNEASYEVPFAVVDTAQFGGQSPIGYPCVVKPVDESGSFGARRCDNDAEYEQASAFIIANRRHVSGYQKEQRLLVERYVPGDEYSAEMVWHVDDGWKLIGFTQKLKGPEPFFVEIGHVFPHRFDPDVSMRVERTLCTCLNSLGLEKTVAHVEFKVVDGEVAIIEVNPRLAGDLIVELVELATGIDLGTLACHAHLGIPWSIPERQAIDRYAAVAFICAERPGRILQMRTAAPAKSVWLQPTPREVGHLQSSADRLGCAIATGADANAAWNAATLLAGDVAIEYA